jgi:hypothetical protein
MRALLIPRISTNSRQLYPTRASNLCHLSRGREPALCGGSALRSREQCTRTDCFISIMSGVSCNSPGCKTQKGSRSARRAPLRCQPTGSPCRARPSKCERTRPAYFQSRRAGPVQARRRRFRTHDALRKFIFDAWDKTAFQADRGMLRFASQAAR